MDQTTDYALFQSAQAHDDAGRYAEAFLDYHAAGALRSAAQMVQATGLAVIMKLDHAVIR